MIDTLKLCLNDYEIAPRAPLELQPSSVNVASGAMRANFPLWHDGTRSIEGAKAFYNGEDFNVTIKPISPTEPDSIACLVQFSVPKVATGSNFHPTDHNGTASALKLVQKHLRGIGIKTNIKTASMSRVDVFKTVEMDEPYSAYHSVLSMLQGQRMAKRDYGTTFLWANTQQEICVYDKLMEMQQRKASIAGLPVNSLRCEHRMLKGRKVQDTLGMKTVGDLLAGYDHVRDVYNAAMQKQLFQRSVSDVKSYSARHAREELEFMRTHNRHWFRAWVLAKGMRSLDVDVESLKGVINEVAGNRSTAHRAIKQLHDAQLDAVALKIITPAKRPIGALYEELKRKVLA